MSNSRSFERGCRPARAALVLVGLTIAGCSGAEAQEALEARGSSTASGSSGGTSGGINADASADASGCPDEVEPNDTAETANVLAPSRCGAVKKDESDFLAFQLKESTTSMQVRFDGQVTLEIQVNGQTVRLGDGTAPKVPFVKGQRYTIQVQATARGQNVPWRVDLIEK